MAAIVILIILAVGAYSQYQIENIPRKFHKYNREKKMKALKKFKFSVAMIKTGRAIEATLKIALVVIIACVAFPVGFFVALGILLFRSSMKDTNYKGYASYKKRDAEYIRYLDDWIVVANQTIFK